MLQCHLFFYHDHWSTFEHENQTSREKKKMNLNLMSLTRKHVDKPLQG